MIKAAVEGAMMGHTAGVLAQVKMLQGTCNIQDVIGRKHFLILKCFSTSKTCLSICE